MKTVTLTVSETDARIIGAALNAYLAHMDAESERYGQVEDDGTLAASTAPWRAQRAGDVAQRAGELTWELGEDLGIDFGGLDGDDAVMSPLVRF